MTVGVIDWQQDSNWVLATSYGSLTFTIPSQVEPGCLLIVFGSSSTQMQVPVGWARMEGGTGTTTGLGIWRVADGTEGASVTVQWNRLSSFFDPPELYYAVVAVFVAFERRSFSDSPAATWSRLSRASVPSNGWTFTALDAPSTSDDSIYLGWGFQASGLNYPDEYGFDAAGETWTLDSDIVSLIADSMARDDGFATTDEDIPQSMTATWRVGYVPIPSGVNPATSSTLTGGLRAISNNSFMARSNQVGIEQVAQLSAYLGMLAQPM